MRKANTPNPKEAPMRLTWKRLAALAAIAAAGLMAGCSADSPGPTGNPNPGPGNGGLQLLFSPIPATKAGNCALVTARATQNGVAVPAGTSVTLSSTFAAFAQNGQQTITLDTDSNGTVTTAICSSTAGTATIQGSFMIGSKRGTGSVQALFTPNGVATLFITICASPHTGPVSGGTPITITGGGFGNDGTTVPIVFRSGGVAHQTVGTVGGGGTTITAITPAFPELAGMPATAVQIDILFPGQTLSSPNCFTYTSDNQPIVTAILPSSGTKVGGTRVTIVGSNFSAPVQVFFGGTLEAQVVSVSPTQIIAITPPANAQGPDTAFPQNVDVTVKEVNCSGATCTSAPVTYTYTVGLSIFGFTPDHGDSSTVVTITGQGFVAPLIVTFGGKQGTVVSVTGTQILAKPPAGCPSSGGPIAVTLLSDGETATAPGSFTVIVPTITSGPSPASGPGGTGTSVTVLGTGFFPPGATGQLSVTAAGGSVTGVSAADLSGQQSVSMTLNPDKCSPSMTVTLIDGATGCSASFTFTNSTFTDAGPTATINTPVSGPNNNQVTFSAAASSSGTPNFVFSWTFTNPDGTSAGSATGQTPPAVTFNCGTGGPACPGPAQANLTVTDACGKSSSASVTAAPK
ncbi:MAG TPA: IPT/TIG domain-containing protein [Thermoanaerobaculia bacterium]|nr:IPT/TIG domain-containing protein [Thermoanaerobaculia bacterium]